MEWIGFIYQINVVMDLHFRFLKAVRNFFSSYATLRK